jgi:hypothetical protein
MLEPTREEVTHVQKSLNRLNKLLGKGETAALPEDGKWDDKSKQAWVDFKKNLWVDSTLAPGYLNTDATGLNLKDKFGKRMTIKKSEKGVEMQFDGKPYNPAEPPREVIVAAQERLLKKGFLEAGEFQSGVMDDATMQAIKSQKRIEWVDERITNGALRDLDAMIKTLEQGKGKAGPQQEQEGPQTGRTQTPPGAREAGGRGSP